MILLPSQRTTIHPARALLLAGGFLAAVIWLLPGLPPRMNRAAAPISAPLSVPVPAPAAAPEWRNPRRIRLAGPYPAQVLEVLDGDTFVARVPIWIGQDIVTRVRLRGVDAPEMRARCQREAALASEARQVLAEFLASGTVFLRDIGTGKYAGRIIARVYVRTAGSRTEAEAGSMLMAGGYARPYRGGRRNSWCGGPSR